MTLIEQQQLLIEKKAAAIAALGSLGSYDFTSKLMFHCTVPSRSYKKSHKTEYLDCLSKAFIVDSSENPFHRKLIMAHLVSPIASYLDPSQVSRAQLKGLYLFVDSTDLDESQLLIWLVGKFQGFGIETILVFKCVKETDNIYPPLFSFSVLITLQVRCSFMAEFRFHLPASADFHLPWCSDLNTDVFACITPFKFSNEVDSIVENYDGKGSFYIFGSGSVPQFASYTRFDLKTSFFKKIT